MLTYLQCALQDKEFEYFWRSIGPSVQNLKISRAAKMPKAVGLDWPEGLDQCFYMPNYMLGNVKILHSSLKPFRLQIKKLRGGTLCPPPHLEGLICLLFVNPISDGVLVLMLISTEK